MATNKRLNALAMDVAVNRVCHVEKYIFHVQAVASTATWICDVVAPDSGLFHCEVVSMTATAQARENDLQKLREMIKDIDFCMLTTVDEDGDLHSRPMSVNGDVDPDGDLWFFTGASSLKVSEIAKLPKVNVSFADTENQHYVSISGKAQ